MSAKPMTRKAWLEYLQKAVDEFDWEAAGAEQEPVIGTKTWFEDGKVVTQHLHPSDIYKDAQPKREWVGMTEEDFVLVHQLCKTPIEAAEYTEYLLKEKNT